MTLRNYHGVPLPEFSITLWTGDDDWDWVEEWRVKRLAPPGSDVTYEIVPPAYDTKEEAEARVAELKERG